MTIPGNLTQEKFKKMAVRNYERWFGIESGSYKQYKHTLNDKSLNITAFDLHQATEHYYSCLFLVLIQYKFYSHYNNLVHGSPSK